MNWSRSLVSASVKARLGVRDAPIDHDDPEDPTAEDRDQLHQTLCGSEPCLFGAATRFQTLMENFDFYLLTIARARQVDKPGHARELRAGLRGDKGWGDKG
jgi:hypothetical protein